MIKTLKKLINSPKDRDFAISECAKWYGIAEELRAKVAALESENIYVQRAWTDDVAALSEINTNAKSHIKALVHIVRSIRSHDLPREFHDAVSFSEKK